MQAEVVDVFPLAFITLRAQQKIRLATQAICLQCVFAGVWLA